ncbi:MAG: double-strand break repair helicase AddA [Micropepsaceae bacterium]
MSDAALIASDPRNSAWVSANAGSGKTYVLTARVIRLLLDGTPPSRLLCLTYTRAAAAEMRARVFKVLGEWALADAATLRSQIEQYDGVTPGTERMAQARRLFATALETPGGLKIQTIHAFCERLVARFPVEADAPVPFTVLTEAEAAAMKAIARQQALAALGGDGADTMMAALAPYVDADGFAGLFEGRSAQLIAQYGDGDPWSIAGLPTGTRAEDIETEAGFDAPDRIALYRAAAAALSAGTKTDQAIAETIGEALATTGEARFERMAFCLLTQKGELRKNLATKATRAAHPSLFDDMDREAERSFTLLRQRAAAESAWMARALTVLGREVARLHGEAKRARGVLDFDDLIKAAAYLLRDAEAAQWALFKLDGGLDHILIDEAQDTSPAQWDVVKRLAEEFFAGAGARPASKTARTLFVVGDEKQSIFSFQGADVMEFGKSRAHFAERALGADLPFETPTLNTSRRSAPAVLAVADAVFRADPALQEAVSQGDWADHVAHRADAPGAVDLWPLTEAEDGEDSDDWTRPVDAPGADDPVTRLADTLATTIKSWIGRESVTDKDTNAQRPLTAGDVLILVRTRGRLAKALVRKMKQHGVPVAGADRLALLEHIAVKDFIAYGRAALLPEDDLNLAALLRSPFFDLDETTLFHLAHKREGSLWARLNAAAEDGIEGVDKARAAAMRTALGQAINRLGRDAPFDFYARLLSEGGRRAMLVRFGEEAEDVIDEFLAAAAAYEELNAPSLEGFLHELEQADGEVKRDPDAAGSAVRVLTTHGAKGLEAPVVILPDTMSLPSATYTPNLLEYEGALVWKPSGSEEAEAAKLAYRAAEHAEHKRLLYVALTRPRDRLIVCGVKPGRATAKDATTWYQAVERGFETLTPLADIDTPFGPGKRYGAPGAAFTGTISAATMAAAPPSWLRTPVPAEEAIGLVRPSRLTAELTFDNAADSFGLQRGRILHRLLQSLPDLPPADRAAAAKRYLEARAAEWPDAMRTDAAARILAILDDPRFAAAFAPGSRAEVSIAGKVAALGASGFISGQIDRLAVTDEAVLIVDYKTNKSPPADAAGTPVAYLRQMALYREAMRAAFPDRRVTAALLWTETPDLVDLPDSLLDAALASLVRA